MNLICIKSIRLTIAILYLLAGPVPLRGYAQSGVIGLTVDFEQTSYPVVNFNRGYVLRDALQVKTQKILDDLEESVTLGMRMVSLPRDLNQFNPNYTPHDFSSYFKSYRSMGPLYFGGDGEKEEFSKNEEGGIDVRVNSEYLEICRYAMSLGLELIVQCSGTPVEGKSDGTVEQLFELDPERKFHESARFYPIPASGEFDAVADAVVQWMRALYDSLQYEQVIFLGHQEPSHTAGYPYGIQTREGNLENIAVYAGVWKPMADKLLEYNMVSGAMQLNESRIDYGPGVSALIDGQVPFDYFSIQNYRAERNDLTLREAISQLDSHDYSRGKKIVFNRYDFKSELITDNEQKYNTSAGITEFLNAEIQLFPYADRILGYSFFTGAQDYPMMDEVFRFLNNMPSERKQIEGLVPGLNAFAFSDSARLSMIVWNNEAVSKEISITLKNVPLHMNEPDITITTGEGSVLMNNDEFNWNADQQTLGQLVTPGKGFIMLTMEGKALGTDRMKKNFTFENSVEVISNPVRNNLKLRFSNSMEHAHLRIFSLSGTLVLEEVIHSVFPGKTFSRNLSLNSGVYLLSITPDLHPPVASKIIVCTE